MGISAVDTIYNRAFIVVHSIYTFIASIIRCVIIIHLYVIEIDTMQRSSRCTIGKVHINIYESSATKFESASADCKSRNFLRV